MKTEIATWALMAMGALGLAHSMGCATPNIPGDEEGEAAGRNETGSPGGAKLPPSSSDKPADSAPATTPGMPSTPAPPLPGNAPVATCDLTLPFAAPVEVTGLPAGQHFATPRLSRDELTIYFTTRSGTTARIARAVRPSLAAPFAAPAVLDAQSSTAKDNDPSVSADGATLWFSSERAGTQDRLYMAQLVAGTAAFGPPQLVPSVGSTAGDQHPYFRVTGGELWFVSSRDGQQDIFVAKKNATGFDAPKRVEELRSTTASSRQPMITEDGLTIVFSSARTGGTGGKDLWIASRAAATAPFALPQPLGAVNSAADEYAGWISNDGCRLYFSSDRAVADTHRVYVASRPPK